MRKKQFYVLGSEYQKKTKNKQVFKILQKCVSDLLLRRQLRFFEISFLVFYNF
jgi:hypothetical protein